ncbi:MAG: peptidoglycan-binding protein [Thermomicrobiales bacterium]
MSYALRVDQRGGTATAERQRAAATPATPRGVTLFRLAAARSPGLWSGPSDLLALQRTVGNRAVQRLVQRDNRPGPAGSAAVGVCPVCGRAGQGVCDCGQPFRPASRSYDTEGAEAARTDQGAESSSSANASPAFPPAGDWFGDPLLQAIRFSAVGSNSALLADGATGPSVTRLQQALRAWGFANLQPPRDLLPKSGADGVYGGETTSAVRQFQARAGVAADGMVGPATLGVLDTYLGGKGGRSDIELSADEHLVGPAGTGGKPGKACPNGGFVPCSAMGTDDSRFFLVTFRMRTARTFVHHAIQHLPSPGDVKTPQGQAFADLFGTPTSANVPRVKAQLDRVAQIFDDARLKEVDPTANPVVLCASDCHPTCQIPAIAFHSRATQTLAFCENFFKEDLLPALAALIHEATHAALPGETDIYSDSRLFDLLSTIHFQQNGAQISAGENNTDSIVSYIFRANGAAKFESTTRGASPEDKLMFRGSDRAREQEARVALAFAHEWIRNARTASSKVRIALDGFQGHTWKPAHPQHIRNQIHLLRRFNAFRGLTQADLDDPTKCQAVTRFLFSCPAIGNQPNLAGDRAQAHQIVTTYDEQFREPLEKPYTIFPVGKKSGGEAVHWLLQEQKLALMDRFFVLADPAAQSRELLLALAREQGLGVGERVAYVSFAQELFEAQFEDF